MFELLPKNYYEIGESHKGHTYYYSVSNSKFIKSSPATCMNPKNNPESIMYKISVCANIFLNDNLNINSSKIGAINTVSIKV